MKLNMFFPNELEAAVVRSRIPLEGYQAVVPRNRGSLWIRKPTWLEGGDFKISHRGKDLSTRQVGPWVVTSPREAGDEIEIRFPLVRRIEQEWVYHEHYRFAYEGDTIVAMSPTGKYAPMYPALR